MMMEAVKLFPVMQDELGTAVTTLQESCIWSAPRGCILKVMCPWEITMNSNPLIH
jgi:hypothetical protein